MRLAAVVRVLALACGLAPACARPASDKASIVGDPSTKPLPPGPTAPPPPPPDTRVCEPWTGCGFWGECTFYEPTGDGRFRALGGSGKGKLYRRYHACYPADAGSPHCSLYCAGPKGGEPCVDGLHPDLEVCTISGPPVPAPFRCVVKDEQCVREP